ncbi:MAG: pyridoxal-5'-phosphate-dependent protein subunit beta [Candidatus Eisenbacteria bacterium]|uniref:Pyridoxal-5'-phosphate-dependent protein subunit beta n=1 Tax=Eiseniibacteriota bacterium TaxID=2212470 RepID=A0A948RW01_UNCEI|nr:pyridoxal-5'-phosphate-dependent protein subunit beta [Candidatus Eisenbacteria bacterium]MBU1947696.1 pyridoxal-5'-phosphate-dependent protein subunit beta [Candidatus Eisenbacteria bacterium]MBU2692060.1 pyridoxal-5'-phosphate-dependent protein subunit beta [Candidatus Eisenbacteria bacterium]
MPKLGLETHVVDNNVYKNSVKRFKDAGIILPSFAELADPSQIPQSITQALVDVDPGAAASLNLFRVHWFNEAGGRGTQKIPDHIVLPKSLTGVSARIIVLFGDLFPMIQTHKVLAAYGCLAPRIITGQFDPITHRAVWPSTGNYCRGGVAISKIMGCRGVAVLPAGMSRERFQWLENWVMEPEDIIKTPGSESNVKEIYDKCNELDADAQNIIFNQFCEFGNSLSHYLCTGRAMESVYETAAGTRPGSRLRAFVASSGSAGTLAAGDYLKEKFGSLTAVVEALECPTILYNGFGEHNIQGIGDKHIPFIHNVMKTDLAMAVSEVSTDALNVLFNTKTGRDYLVERKEIPWSVVEALGRFGLSSICNIMAAVKIAKHYDMGPDDVIMTVATDGAELYRTERDKVLKETYSTGFSDLDAAEVFGRDLMGITTDHLLELSHLDRQRIFNLGYYTWVEQQGVTIEEFTARRENHFWTGLRELIPVWDEMIAEFNSKTGLRKSTGAESKV